MDIPYKGYTIVPNSERQPDGRWLPVADLQADDHGVLTPQPPLRAAPRDIRATRADADVLAVKMAKAWIEEIERGEASGRPTRSAVATPRTSPEPRTTPDTRVKAAPRAKRTEADTLGWPGLHAADRFTRLLAVHSLLDRLVTLALAARLAASGESIADALATLPLSSRVALASTSSAVPRAAAESILEIDRMRNRLVHSTPTPGKPTWDVSGAAESIPPDVYDRCLRKGFETAQSLITMLRDAARE